MNGLKISIAMAGMCLGAPSFAQIPYGLTIQSGIYTDLPTTDLGGGGPFSESSTPIGPAEETSASVPAYGHSDAVEGRDPSNGALYTARASSAINFLAVSNGALQLSIATSGGTADANLGVQGTAQSYQVWQDTLTVSGPPLGNPVTLVITDNYRGNIKVAGSSTVEVVHQIELDDISCQENCSIAPYEIFTAETSVDSKRKYLLHTRSGDTVTLFEYLAAFMNGSLQWQLSADFSNVAICVGTLEPGVIIKSASHVEYCTP